MRSAIQLLAGHCSALCLACVCALLVLFASSPLRAEEPVACGTEDLLAGRAPVKTSEAVGDLGLATDGHVAHTGAQWDDSSALVLRSTDAYLTYDLGAPRSLAALYVQADANDDYPIEGSMDGTEGSFRLLATAGNVLRAEGGGLRARSVRLEPPSLVRFVRLRVGGGDGAYSLSEFAAYCQLPAPFPPRLAISAASVAPVGYTPAALPAEPKATGQRGLTVLSVLLALVGLGCAWALRRNGAAPAKTQSVALGVGTEKLLLGLFLVSGCAALVYEVVWLHLLRLVIGASSLSVAIVLASFMGGMFLGSLLFSRWVSEAQHPLRVYAWLELGIGGCGLLMPLVLPLVRSVYVGLVGYGPLDIALRALVAAAVLLPPTALMGATLPAVARRYGHGQGGMAKLAALYSANTLGAVLGSLLSAFYLLAVWNIWVATLAAAAMNALVCLIALRLSRGPAQFEPEAAVESGLPSGSALARSTKLTSAVYFVAAASGFTALGAQVVWTRLLTLLFGATVYAFALILAVFLAALGVGSALATFALRRGVAPARALAWTQAALVPALLLSATLLSQVVPYASPGSRTPQLAFHALHVLRAADVILPAGLLWGLSFPFALAAAGLGAGDPARSSGRLYAANTVGAILGALAVSFWLIPSFGTQRAEQVLVLVAGLSAAVLIRALALRNRGRHKRRSLAALALPIWILSAATLCAAFLPGMSQVFLAHGRYIWNADPLDRYEYVSEGASSTVAVHVAPDGSRQFHVSGRVEASNNPADMRLERLLGHLSALSHPNPESILVVGLGAGITAGSLTLHPEVKRIVICEIEPRVAGAAARFARENYDVLHDPRVTLIFDDARHFLATTHERFDVITSDPIHPWVRGNSILFSREYYRIVRSRLKPGGVATQWVPLYETSEMAIKIQMRTFSDAFPNGTVWNSAVSGRGYDVVLLGSERPLQLDVSAIQARIERTRAVSRSLSEAKIASAVDLLGTYATNGHDMQRWLSGTPVNDDFSLKLEYISGLALNDAQADPIFAHMVQGRRYPTGMLVASKQDDEELRRRLP